MKKDRLSIVTAWIAAIFLGACGLWGQVWGGTVYQVMTTGSPDSDSTFIVRRDMSDSTLIDSALFDTAAGVGFAAFPYDTLYTWNDAKDYDLKLGIYYPGAGWYTWNSWKKFSGTIGTGTYTVNLLFADTTGGGVAGVPYVQVDLRGWNTSTLLGTDETNASGVATFGTNADSVAFRGVGPTAEYIWPVLWEDSVAGSGNLTDTVKGYKIDVPVSSGSQVCAVTVIVLDNAGEVAHNVRVTAYLTRSNLRDSAGYAVANYLQEKKTDTLGRATFQCRWSSYLIPATKWRFTVRTPGVGMTKKDITVPRQTSYTLEF